MKFALRIVLFSLALGVATLRAADTPTPTLAPPPAPGQPVAVKLPPGLNPTPAPTIPPKLASDESVKALLLATRARQLVDSLQSFLDTNVGRASRQTAATKHLTPAQMAAFNAAVAKDLAGYKAEFAWEKLEPNYIDAYSRAFTEEQTKAITAFYQTDAGQALLLKLSGVMKSVMTGQQMQMQSMFQRVQKDLQAAAAQAIAAFPAPSPTPTGLAPAVPPATTLVTPVTGASPTPATH